MITTEINKSVETSEALAIDYFNKKMFQESINQNLITIDLLGYRHPDILKNIAISYYSMYDVEKALEFFQEYMDITKSKDQTDIRQYAQYLSRLGRYDEAYEYIKTNQSECDGKHLDIGWFLHREGKFKEAFHETEIGRNGAFWTGNKYPPDCPRWFGYQPIKGAKLCLIGEAGLGDEMIFSRWIPILKDMGAIVYYYTDNSLKNVICRNFQIFPVDPTIRYDYWMPSMSLPYNVKAEEPGNKSYLKPNPIYVAKWKEKLKDYKDIIALNWTGDKNHTENEQRTIPIDYLVDKIKDKGTLVSVCMGAETCPDGVIDLTKDIKDWDDTIAILSLCKMCYTSSSSVSVAAGALGIKTYLYDIVVGYFTWCAAENGGKSDWFPDVTVWRQEKMGDWKSVIDRSLGY
jgi:tetratricopeptide (TPR) repeat protein